MSVEYSSSTLPRWWQLCRRSTDPAWRRPLVGRPQRSRLPHARVPPLAHQSEYASLPDSLRDQLPQMAPVHVVEPSTDLRIDSPGDVQRPTRLTPLMPRVMGTVALPAALGAGMQSRCDDGCQDRHHRPLDHLVLAAGLPSWPLLPLVLLDPYPLDWRGPIPMGAEPCMQGPQGVVQVRRLRRGRHLVYPRCPLLAGPPRGCQKAVLVAHVTHVVAPHRWRALCLWRHALELPGDGG